MFFFSQHKNKISRSGELIITSEVSRYQMKNLADCLEKIRGLIAEATEKPVVPSKEKAQMIADRYDFTKRAIFASPAYVLSRDDVCSEQDGNSCKITLAEHWNTPPPPPPKIWEHMS